MVPSESSLISVGHTDCDRVDEEVSGPAARAAGQNAPLANSAGSSTTFAHHCDGPGPAVPRASRDHHDLGELLPCYIHPVEFLEVLTVPPVDGDRHRTR